MRRPGPAALTAISQIPKYLFDAVYNPDIDKLRPAVKREPTPLGLGAMDNVCIGMPFSRT